MDLDDISYYFQPRDSVDLSQLQLTGASFYSITPWREGNFISRTILNFYGGRRPKLKSLLSEGPIVTDATAHVGGNTISFHLSGIHRVNAVEIDSSICEMLKNNLRTYHFSTDHVYCQDYLKVYRNLVQDVVFLDPPWGGREYLRQTKIELCLSHVNLIEICQTLLTEKRVSLIVLKLPINYGIQQLVDQLSTKTVLTHKIYRGSYPQSHHSYNVVFCW